MESVDLLRAACCIAGLDGEVSASELLQLKKLAEHAGVGKASLNAMVSRACEDPNFYQEQFEITMADPDATMKTLVDVAAADGVLKRSERVILGHFAVKLGLDPAKLDACIEEAEKRIGGSSGERT